MTKIMNEDFLDVLQDKGPATIVSINGNPASVVNTWSQYINVVSDDIILIPAAGMHSIEQDFEKDPKHELIITIGSYNYSGTAGMGRGYHIHGSGQFINEGAYFDQMKAQFDWIRAVLVVKIHDVEQKIQQKSLERQLQTFIFNQFIEQNIIDIK